MSTLVINDDAAQVSHANVGRRARWDWLSLQLTLYPYAAVAIPDPGAGTEIITAQLSESAAHHGIAIRMRQEPLRLVVWRSEFGLEPPRTEQTELFFDPFFLRLWGSDRSTAPAGDH